MHSIGNRIKQRRKELKLTQTQIKELTGISSGNMSDVENGKTLPSATALISLSKALNCSIDWILTGNCNTADNYTDSEKSLIDMYRHLSEDDQDEILVLTRLKYNRNKKERSSRSDINSIA